MVNVHDCIIVNSIHVRSEFGKFAYTAICMRNVYTPRPKKNICVFTVTCQKKLGSVGWDYYFFFFFFFLLSTKPEIVVPGSGIQFRYLIFENSGKMTNYAVFLPSLLSISTKS